MSKETEYFKIPVTDFTEESSLLVDLYAEISSERVQKIAKKGSSFSIRQIPFSTNKHLQWLLLKKEDYRFYVNFTIGQGGHPLTLYTEIQRKLITLKQKIESNIAQFTKDGLLKTSLDIVQNTLQNVLHLIIENPVTYKLLEKIERLDPRHDHALGVVIWSQILALQLGWSGEPTSFRVALCALFHDIGFNDNPDEIKKKPFHELTEHDKRVLEGHVLRGRDILSSISGLPSEVITVAYQHHEFVDGTGYPEKLYLDEIHPIARLIAILNRFQEIYINTRTESFSLFETFQIFKKEQANYDLRFFKTLEEVILRK